MVTLCQVEVAEPLGPGIDGLLGVAFDGIHSSAIMATLDGSNWDTTLGEPFLYNIFDQTPEQNNFIGISLSRTGDLEGSADASFIINEINEAYAKVTQAPLLPIFPGNNRRWSILMDGISVDGVNITLPTSTVPNTPDGKIVVVMDTGTPSVLLPDKLVSDIYSSIPGAQSGAAPDQSGVTWTVPCNTTTIVTIYFGFALFPDFCAFSSSFFFSVGNLSLSIHWTCRIWRWIKTVRPVLERLPQTQALMDTMDASVIRSCGICIQCEVANLLSRSI
jgi:hypothetical protein